MKKIVQRPQQPKAEEIGKKLVAQFADLPVEEKVQVYHTLTPIVRAALTDAAKKSEERAIWIKESHEKVFR